MGDEPIIRFQNVSKRFAFTREQTQSILKTVASAFSGHKADEKSLWAVRDVTFTVMPGQSFGIVGRNGSGKSTILKLVARILRPTDGRIVVRGRVSALLELGAGFHQDLTGRENIFLNASMLGLEEAEAKARYNDIVAFSELGDFIEMPVKHYSSGMYMRLGFSVAIYMRPDVLIVDEILAVGDQAFQAKCLDAILELRRQGVTIIVVSHNLNVMHTLCTHLLWIDRGVTRAVGPAAEVAALYQAYAYEQESRQVTANTKQKSGSEDMRITAVRFLNARGQESASFQTGEAMTIEMAYTAHRPIDNPEVGLAIYRQDGVQVNGPNTRLAGLELGVVEGTGVICYQIERLPLLPARYQVTVAVHDGRTHFCYDYQPEAYTFWIAPGSAIELEGLIALSAVWEHAPVQPVTTLPLYDEPLLQ